MTALLEFISGLLEGLGLLAVAVSMGGVAYVLCVLRATSRPTPIMQTAAEQSLRAIALAGGVLAFLRCARLTFKWVELGGGTDDLGLWVFVDTQMFHAGLFSALLAAGLAVAALWVRRNPDRRRRWTALVLTGGMFMVNEAWLSHAGSRVEGAGLLMTVTLAHVLGATVWAGGITHLLLFWRWARRDPQAAAYWPELVSRFSPLGIVSVTLIIAPGLYLAWRYLGDWSGLVGTGYGNLLVVKIVLFACVLVLAGFNFWTARRWRRTGDPLALARRVPAYIEVELVLAGALLFTAATLASFPPAVDLVNDRVSPADMWRMFSPKVPHLGGPEIILIKAPELTDLQTGRIGQKENLSWDRFNHNVSGIIVGGMALLALLDRIGGFPWARHWPLLFIAFSILIFVFANPTEWPLGRLGFWESLQNAEVVQHWLAAFVVLGLGWFEWRARLGGFANRNLRYVFPVLCIVGGIILLTHSHDISEVRQEFLTQSTHVAMGAIAVIMGCSRWLELRFSSSQGTMAAGIAAVSMLLIGFILMFYVDPEDFATWSKLK